MSQQIINLGSGPDTQTGDTVSVAFTKVNNNFTELYSVFDGNGITTINANVIFANNIVTTTNVRTGNLFAYGNIESVGYVITTGAFYPNGVPIGSLSAIDSNLIPLSSNVYTLGNVTRQFSQAYIGSNLTLAGANLTVIDGNLYINNNLANGNFGNSNVAALLPIYTGNLGGTITTVSQPYITSVGVLSSLGVSGNLVVGGNLRVDGNVTYFNVENLTTEDPIINLNTGANGAPLSFNNGYDSGIKTNYYNSNSRSAFFGRIDSSGFFEYYSNVTAEVGNIVSGTYGTIKSANLILTDSANITGNVTGNYFLGNGRFLTGIDATSIQNGNSNVKVYANGNVSVTTAGTNTWNFDTTGQLTVPGAILTASTSKLDLVGFGPNTAYLTTTADDSTALFMGAAVVDLRSSDAISIATNTDDITYTWNFDADGNLTAPGNIGVTGNVSAPYFTGNFSGNFTGNFTGTAANTQILFSDNNSINGTSGFTFDKATNLVTVGGTLSSLAVNVAGYTVIDSNGNVVTSRLQNSGVIAGTYGNASAVPSFTVDGKGRITGVSNIAVAGVSNLTYNQNTSNLALITSAGTVFYVDLNVGIDDSPTFANATLNQFLTVLNTANVGQLNVNGVTVVDTGSEVVTSRLKNSGVIPGIYGNANAVPVFSVDEKGRVLGVSNVAISGISNVSYDTTTGNISITTSDGTSRGIDIGVGTADSPIFAGLSIYGNATANALTVNNSATIGSTLGVTGNINGNGITLTGSLVASGSGDFDGGLQSTPIGNATASTGQFTTVSATGNVTGAALTSNGSITAITSLSAAGGIQNTPIGNVSPSTALFTTVGTSGNSTINALTVNNSTTIGSTLGVTGNIVGANIRAVNGVFATVESATVGNTGTNYTGSTYTATGSFNGPLNGTLGSAGGNSAIVSTLSGTGAAALSSLQVNNAATVGTTLTVGGLATLNSFYANTNSTVGGNLTVVGNLVVSGNVVTTGSNNTYFTDSIIELHTLPNLANLTFDDGKDIGIRFHYYKTENSNAFLGWQNSTGYLEWLGSGATEDVNANIITGSYGTFKTGELILANATPSTGSSTGALQVNGGASFNGNIYANGVAYFGNATAISLTNPLIVATTTANTYAQIQIQNQSTGGAASSDFIATADDGTDTTKFIDMGINSSGWNQSTWTVSGPRDGYLYTSGVNLTLGTDTVGKTLKIHTGGLLAACVVATFNDAGTVSSSSTTGALVLTGGLGVSGAINGGSTLGLVGNATVSGLAVNNTATIGSTLGVTGNINGTSATLSGSIVTTGPGQHIGGLQATPIGNAAASTGQFTSVSATGNITGAALTSNGSITAITTLSAAGGIQNTPIGNVTPSTAIFTSESVSGNSTVSALTVNNTATIGSTLGVTGNINGSGVTLTGSLVARGPGDFDGGLQSTPIGNATASTGQFTTVSATGNITGAGLTVNGSATIGTTLSVTSNITVGTGSGGNITGANFISANSFVAAVSFNGPLNGTLGSAGGNSAIVSTLSATSNATVNALTVNNSTTIGSTLGVTGNATVGNILAGGFFFANGTPLTTSAGGTSGQVQFNNGGTFAGATGFTVSGSNVSIANLTINSSATIGTTLGVTGNVTVGNITTAGLIRTTATTAATSNVTGAVQVSGGVGVAGNIYVGQRVGWVAANSVSVVYQVYNAATNSLDTIFG